MQKSPGNRERGMDIAVCWGTSEMSLPDDSAKQM